MAGVTTTFANRELDNYLGGPTLARPATVYIQLCTSAPSAAAAGTAVLARVAVTNNSTNWPASSSGSKSNGTTIAFGSTAGATYSNVVGWEVWDALTGGNRSFYGAISSTSISDRSAVNFPAGSFVITRT